MIYAEKQITIRGEHLILNNLRALFWQCERALIASDLHVGKSAHFRKHGIPISVNVQHNDLDRLSFLVSHYQAKKLIVVGDLFHAEVNTDMNLFKTWRAEHPDLEIILIKGNHDRLKHVVYDSFDINCCQQELNLQPFKFIHEPELVDNEFTISGHIHPGVLIKTKGKQRIKLPCFQVSDSNLILPAFSEFTGLATSNNQKFNTYHAFTETAFFEF
ncbi:ligase-associated DNA damage response endonuclease PdeM [Psychroserpens burtonensis]|uniref:Ligase-associated DNA damage response endonuclease PdeM n=1 Tax=Psychroserpens burtonensis TaxID=49278 RepID=A0A5C7BC10_9FLAO|nr:ligase-associated DNA damage response endonuclease PdeM [Psychroserpens burtonensis]TXE19661.1 ligase-associated DNA damage response endonuclease PdeM [Psychroserpens burtonensis]